VGKQIVYLIFTVGLIQREDIEEKRFHNIMMKRNVHVYRAIDKM